MKRKNSRLAPCSQLVRCEICGGNHSTEYCIPKQTEDRPERKYLSYSEKLKDPRWQRMRLEVFQRDRWKCRDCGSESNGLHAHHLWYEFGKDPWSYRLGAIICLCDSCHNRRHAAELEFDKRIRARLTTSSLENWTEKLTSAFDEHEGHPDGYILAQFVPKFTSDEEMEIWLANLAQKIREDNQ